MTIGSQEWISESLARLEQLEQQRDAHEAELEHATDANALRAHSEAIDRLDEEIRQLYATLEAVAAQEEGSGEAEDEATATNEFQRELEAPATAPASDPFAAQPSAVAPAPSPFGAPQPAASPFNAGPATSPFDAAAPSPSVAPMAGFAPNPDFAADYGADLGDDLPNGGGKGKWIAVAAIGVAAVAAVVIWKQAGSSAAPPPVAAQPTDVQVIKASAVPPDTQGPKSAVGADVTATPEREYTKSERSPSRSRSRSSRGGSSRSGNSQSAEPKQDGRKIKIAEGEDPFG